MTVKDLRLFTDTGKPVDVTKKCECDYDTMHPTTFMHHNGEDVYVDETCGHRLSMEDKLSYDLHHCINGFDEDNRDLEDCGDE